MIWLTDHRTLGDIRLTMCSYAVSDLKSRRSAVLRGYPARVTVPAGSCLSRHPEKVFSRWWHRVAKVRSKSASVTQQSTHRAQLISDEVPHD